MSISSWCFTLGIIFVLIGIGFFLWGKKEAHDYELSLLSRRDLREFMERTPERPEPEALKNGGVIGVVVGLWLLLGGLLLL
ncbi:MAG: hypothetical protein FWE97_03680 [Dehalococcoidia bacterium]|nr:hypothetical protein [Dehalococcoidia bacterium]